MIKFTDGNIALPIFNFNKTLQLYAKNDGTFFLTDGWNTDYITLYNPALCKGNYFATEGYFKITLKMKRILNRLSWVKHGYDKTKKRIINEQNK